LKGAKDTKLGGYIAGGPKKHRFLLRILTLLVGSTVEPTVIKKKKKTTVATQYRPLHCSVWKIFTKILLFLR
jgi:hypothetical protein